MKRALALASICAASTLAVSSAQAGGLEYNGAGARALGRGGAFAARADDPMALQYNPARMVDLEGSQLLLSINAALYDVCAARSGNFGDNFNGDESESVFSQGGDPTGWANQAFPEVCNQTPFSPGASLVFTHRFNDQWALGVGLLTPTAAASVNFGDDGRIAGGTLPNPVRYQLQKQNHLLFRPTVGVAYKPLRWLRLGANFEWGVARLSQTNYAVQGAGENPAGDLRTDFVGTDAFIPALTTSVDIEPMDGLNFMLGFRWSDKIRANGDLTVTSGDFAPPPQENWRATTNLSDVRLTVPMAWSLSFGARYAMMRSATEREVDTTGATSTNEPPRPRDPMRDEVFDVEVDAVFERNSMVNQFDLALPQGSIVNVGSGIPGSPSSIPLPDNRLGIVLPHQWRDQITLKVGGDWNVIRSLLAVRAGFHYESSGIDKGYTQLDFFPSERYGVHLGATVRLMERLDLSLAYAHIFHASVTVSASDAQYRQLAPLPLSMDTPAIVNAGKYTASIDVLSLQASYRF